MMIENLISEILIYIRFTLEKYGWPILFSILALLYIKPYVNSLTQKLSLNHCNRPERKSALDKEVMKIRVNQQEEYIKKSREMKLVNESTKKSQPKNNNKDKDEKSPKDLADKIAQYKKENSWKYTEKTPSRIQRTQRRA
jgi:hypothetical protein